MKPLGTGVLVGIGTGVLVGIGTGVLVSSLQSNGYARIPGWNVVSESKHCQ